MIAPIVVDLEHCKRAVFTITGKAVENLKQSLELDIAM